MSDSLDSAMVQKRVTSASFHVGEAQALTCITNFVKGLVHETLCNICLVNLSKCGRAINLQIGISDTIEHIVGSECWTSPRDCCQHMLSGTPCIFWSVRHYQGQNVVLKDAIFVVGTSYGF